MKLLLDTHTVLGALDSPELLGTLGRQLIEDAANEPLISPIIPWEISIKANKHKQIPHILLTDFHQVLKDQGFTAIGVDPLHAIRSGLLPFHHRDPFDRLLAAQSLELNVALISKDQSSISTAFNASGRVAGKQSRCLGRYSFSKIPSHSASLALSAASAASAASLHSLASSPQRSATMRSASGP